MKRATFAALAGILILTACGGSGSGGSEYAAQLRGDAPVASPQPARATIAPLPTPQPTIAPVAVVQPVEVTRVVEVVITATPQPTVTPDIAPEPQPALQPQTVTMPNAEPFPADRRGCTKNVAGLWECVP